MIILSILLILLSIGVIYQTKILKKVQKENLELKSKLSDIHNKVDKEISEKQKEIETLNFEIEALQKKEEYIKLDQKELNEEYEYLQERNKKLENKILYIEEKLRYKMNV